MPLHPQAQALFDFLGLTTLPGIGLTTLPGIETLTPQAARDRFKTLTEARKLMGAENIREVRDVAIPGPAGEIQIRIYTPDVPRPAPALIFYHGGGW